MSPEIVDLVLRAHHRGPEHGLPFSFMDSNHKGPYDKTLQTQARIVDGDLMLFSRSTMDMKIDQETIDLRIFWSRQSIYIACPAESVDCGEQSL